MNKGFVSIPILVITVLSTVIVGGGGYTVYKLNQMEEESNTRVAELEDKIEAMNTDVTESISTTTTEGVEESTTFDEQSDGATLDNSTDLTQQTYENEVADLPTIERSASEEVNVATESVNYIGVLLSFWRNEINASQQLKPILNTQYKLAKDRRDELEKLLSMARSGTNDSDQYIRKSSELLEEAIEIDIGSSERVMSLMTEWTGYLDDHISQGQTILSDFSNVTWTQEQALNFIAEKETYADVNKEISDGANLVWESYMESANDSEDFYEEVALGQEEYLEGMGDYIKSIQYQPVNIPQYQLPKTQRTHCNVFDGFFTCDTTY